VDGELSFSDALSNLDFAFMGAFEARTGKLSFVLDYMVNDLSFGNTTPGPAFGGLESDFKTQILTALVAYRVHETPVTQVDLAGGLRWFNAESTFGLTPGARPCGSTTLEDDWVDPVLGARLRYQFADRWASTAYVDYGGFSSDSETWQVLLTADCALTDRWQLRFGNRYLCVDHDIKGNDFSFDQSGPIFGTSYRF
jgi:hypothetical protein